MLDDAQRRLQARYKEISSARRALGYPVYACEHGLDQGELLALKNAASAAIKYVPPSQFHWLVWAALGAEAGYEYSGDEYWPALERRPGEWRSNDFRQSLREIYRRFDCEFRGPKPVGRWADHFSIIAWPITHSILPKYLQAHFARHLFDLRHDLAHLAQGDGRQVGDLLFSRYTGTSSRFRDFLQQADLTSQIVLALRDEELSGNVTRIEPDVLRRIVTDLEERRDVRTYLRDARKLIQSSGIRISPPLRALDSVPSGSQGTKSTALPRIRLAARRLGDGGFALGIQLPDFRMVLKEAALDQAQIADQRIRFAGENERLIPASNLLTLSRQERKLDRFPDADAPLIVPEDTTHALARLIASVARLEERPTWVLRRQTDGLFREILGGHIRARHDYLILCRWPLGHDIIASVGLTPTQLDLVGAHAYHLKTPDRLGEQLRAALKSIGVGTATGVSVDPVGLNPAPGSELPTWQTTEPVMLRLTADYDVKRFSISVDEQASTTIACERGEVLLKLEELEPGRHRVAVSIPPFTVNGTSNSNEQFHFSVAAPRPWPEAMRNKSGFRLVLEPPNAQIEDLIGRRATLQVIGPPSRTVHWSIETFDAAGHLAASGSLGSTKIGDPASAVQAIVEKIRTTRSDDIDEAYQVDVVASLDELGRQAQKFPRIVEPLRWKFDPRLGIVRLIDETDHMAPVTVRSYPLDEPVLKVGIDTEAALVGFKPPSPGALLIARYKKTEASIFVSVRPVARIMDLADLGVSQKFTVPEDPGTAAVKLIDGMRRWSKVKPVGHLALLRRDTTVDKLRSELAAFCCGRDFATLLTSPQTNLERLQAKVGGSQGFGYRMRTSEWSIDVKAAAASFLEFARVYQVENQPSLAHHALTLAYAPLLLRLENVDEKAAYLSGLLANRTLLRGAFLARAVALMTSAIPLKESA
jgi:hypothetical protein